MLFDQVAQPSQKQFLPGRGTLPLDDAEGTVIAVESGCLWITMQDDIRDIVLTPGMWFEIDRSGRTLVAAEEDSRFALLAADDCPEGIAPWVTRKLVGLLPSSVPTRRRDCAPYPYY